MAFYFALLNVSNAQLDNKLHHGNRRSRSTGHRPPNPERRHSFSSTTSNEVVNDYRLLPRPRILSSQSVVRPPTPPQRRSHECVVENNTRDAQAGHRKTDRNPRREGGESSSSTADHKTQNQIRNIKKVTFETDRNGDVVSHHTRRVPFLDDPEAWGSETTGCPNVGHRPRRWENPESRWKWIAKMRYLTADQRELNVRPQKKSPVDASTVVGETPNRTRIPPPAYPDITDSPIETSSDDYSECSPEGTSSDRSSSSDIFVGSSKRKYTNLHRISRKPWKILTENNAIDASWKSTKNFMNVESVEKLFSRSSTFRILRENMDCAEPVTAPN